MRRCPGQNNGSVGSTNEFHLDVQPVPIWHNSSMAPVHVQLLRTNINGHHAGIDHLINSIGDQMEQSGYLHNYVYSSQGQHTPFNGNGTIYFAHPSPSINAGPPPSQMQPPPPPPPPQQQFHQYQPRRTFENSNRHQFQHLPHFQSSPVFQPSACFQPPTSLSSNSNIHHQDDYSSIDVPPRFRHLKTPERENVIVQQRPTSDDFEHLHNSHQLSANSATSRFNHDNRFHSRPKSFYDFSSYQQSNNNNSNKSMNNSFRSSNNHRYQRNNLNNNDSLPLSAYMNTDHSSNANANIKSDKNWNTSYQSRRSTQQRTYNQDKHQFPLSSYDPRQYGFNNNYQQRHDLNNRTNTKGRHVNSNRHNNHSINESNDIDLIEEWWEDDNNTQLIGTNPTVATITTIDDSGHSSLSTSIVNLNESTYDDYEENHSINPSSDISTTDNSILQSLDQLQQQLQLEEAVDECLTQTTNANDSNLLISSMKESGTYNTAHFMQWAKKTFREELAGRLTAQEIQQHDDATTDNDEDDIAIVSDGMERENTHYHHHHRHQTTDQKTQQRTTNDLVEKIDSLPDDLHQKLTLDIDRTNTISTQTMLIE